MKTQYTQQFFDLSLDMFCVANFDGYFIDLNPAWERILGWSMKELCSKPYVEFVHPEDRGATHQEAGKLADGGTVLEFQNRYLHKNGTWKILSWRAIPDEARKLIFAVARDVTVTQQLEDIRRESEQKFRALFETSTFGIANIHSTTWAFLDLNPAFEKLLGISKTGIMGLTLPDLLPGLELEMKGNSSFGPIEKEVFRKDGSAVWLRITGTRSTDSRGVISYWINLQDVTEKKKLDAERDRLLGILDATPDLIGMATPDGIAIHQNQSASKYWGPKRAGASISEFHPSWAIKVVMEEGIPWAVQHGHWDGETAIYDLARNEVPVWQTILAHKNKSGELEFLSTVMRDLTQQKADRARTLHSSKLASLGEMAGGIAHEINNPLAIIHGKSSQLREKSKAGKATPELIEESLQKIESTAMRIAKIVKGLRTFSRSSEADPFEDVDFATVIDETLSLCMAKFQNHGIEIRIKPIPSIRISCRPAQLSQVLLNLLNNARDAVENLEEKWIELEVSEQGDRVIIKVTDSGKGIPPAVAQRLMEPFFTTKAVGKGIGLGLSISKGIAEEYHGNFCYNDKSKNTQFIFEFPKQQSGPWNAKPAPRSQDLR